MAPKYSSRRVASHNVRGVLTSAGFSVLFGLPGPFLLFAAGGPEEADLVFGIGGLVIGLYDSRSGECVRFGVWTCGNR
jgi:hypothetical protein